jgi:alkylation response protein AidB-like acyl-CoA dehydrogenase
MNIRTYVLESMVYRTAGLFDTGLAEVDLSAADVGYRSAKAIAEYQLECSINKVFGSETLDFVADEGVQIHGGYGYTKEYRIERIYRDSRINRIFEGTNEINRLLIPGTLMKRALKGELPLLQKAMELQAEMMERVSPPEGDGVLEQEAHLLVGAGAVQTYQAKLEQEQEVLSYLADIMISIFAMESALLRTQKRINQTSEEKAKLAILLTTAYIQEEFGRIENWAKEVLSAIASGDMLRTQLSVLKKWSKRTPLNLVTLKREIAAQVIQSESYVS